MERISSLAARVLLHLLYAASLSVIAADARADDPVARFNLPSEPLPQALIDFYHQSGVEPGFAPTPRMEQSKSAPVSGVMASSAALGLLLQGTGYTYRRDTGDSVDIVPVEEPSRRPQLAAVPGPAAGPVVPRRLAVEQDPGRLERVDVTGSLIRGVQDVIAPLLHLQRQQLAQTDFATVQDSLYSLPIISLNGPREDLGLYANYQYGAGLDLRGLGVGATLVLVNGRRQPLSGLNGDFVDVSTIPWSAVERIEVLPDGASALYGSDAVAGVVNIIMRNDFEGAETQVRYGTAIGGRREVMASQLLGTHWSSGHAMLAYQFSDTTPLAAAERPYAANADKTPYGGGNYDSYYSNPGNILSPVTLQPVYGIPAAQSGRLTAAALSPTVNLENQYARYQLFPDVKAHELYGAAAQDINSRLQIFAEGRFAERDALRDALPDAKVLVVPPSNPFYVNPFANVPYTLVAYSFAPAYGVSTFSARSEAYVGTAGAKLRFGDTWQAELTESYGRQSLRSDFYNLADPALLSASLADSSPATAFDPFVAAANANPATLAAIERDYVLHMTASIESTRLVADGSLFRMPAGDAQLAVGVERRRETLFHDIADPLQPAETTIPQSYARHISSIFSQLALPLIGDPANPRAVPRLDLDLAGRYEHYSDFGGTFNPTVRIRLIPIQAIKLRASWGRSFRAPTLDNLYDSSNNGLGMAVLPDPRSPTGRSLVFVEQGSNPNLKQETAKTWTAGFDLAPGVLPGASFSLTYYSIEYENRISQPAADNPFGILIAEAEWAPVITRNPTRAQVQAFCESPDYQGSVPQCLASSPAAIIDGRLANLATTKTTGLDLDAHDSFRGRMGALTLGVTANYVFKFDQAVTSSSAPTDIVNTFGNPLALRLRGTIGWNREGPELPGPGLDLAVNYTGGYRNPASTLVPDVSPWTTLDARFVYRTRQGAGWLGGAEVSANITNVFNHDPPFVDNMNGYDPYNVQALGRVVSVDIVKRW